MLSDYLDRAYRVITQIAYPLVATFSILYVTKSNPIDIYYDTCIVSCVILPITCMTYHRYKSIYISPSYNNTIIAKQVSFIVTSIFALIGRKYNLNTYVALFLNASYHLNVILAALLVKKKYNIYNWIVTGFLLTYTPGSGVRFLKNNDVFESNTPLEFSILYLIWFVNYIIKKGEGYTLLQLLHAIIPVLGKQTLWFSKRGIYGAILLQYTYFNIPFLSKNSSYVKQLYPSLEKTSDCIISISVPLYALLTVRRLTTTLDVIDDLSIS